MKKRASEHPGRHQHGHRHGRRRRPFEPEEESTLASVAPGEFVQIADIDDDVARAQAIRLGIHEGAEVCCSAKLPCGPIVLKCGRQEIAVGRGLARRIRIRREERAGRWSRFRSRLRGKDVRDGSL
ncbi:MAG: hypothetical protein Kow0056_12570 [Coriobacteriia bacterium]